ncbi:MAG: hypothetical protein ACOCV2_07840 [Persicimonas sp.]
MEAAERGEMNVGHLGDAVAIERRREPVDLNLVMRYVEPARLEHKAIESARRSDSPRAEDHSSQKLAAVEFVVVFVAVVAVIG